MDNEAREVLVLDELARLKAQIEALPAVSISKDDDEWNKQYSLVTSILACAREHVLTLVSPEVRDALHALDATRYEHMFGAKFPSKKA